MPQTFDNSPRRSQRVRINTKFYKPTDKTPRTSLRSKTPTNRLSPTSFSNQTYY
jgi:hypothetical protein